MKMDRKQRIKIIQDRANIEGKLYVPEVFKPAGFNHRGNLKKFLDRHCVVNRISPVYQIILKK